MDIDPADQFKLANILDAEHKGKIDVNSILSGLQRLKGTQRRSDVISVEFVAIAIQNKLSKIHDELHLMLTSRMENDDYDYDHEHITCDTSRVTHHVSRRRRTRARTR